MQSTQYSRYPDSPTSQYRSNMSNGRRRKRRTARSRSPQASSTETARSCQSYQPNLWTWIDHVPQSRDDQTIIANVQQVFAFAEQWVNNYYLDIQNQKPHGVPSFDEQAFRNLPPGISIVDILCKGAHPTTVIKHCLVSQLLTSISFNGEGSSVSLLPAEFTSLVSAIQRSKADEIEVPHFDAALASYRVLSHYIGSTVNEDEHFIRKRDESIDLIVASFEATFAPWADVKQEPDRRLHALVGLLQRTSDVGILLFSQPSTFSFQWRVSNSPSHDVEIAITPWVLKMSDENAQRIDPAQPMMKVKTEKTYFLAPPLSRKGILCATQNTPHPNLALEMPNTNRHNPGDPSSYVVTRKAVAATGSPSVNLRSIAPHAPVTSEQHDHTAYELAGNDRQLGNRELVPRESRQPSQPVQTSEEGTAFERRGYIQPSQRLQQDPREQGVPLTTVQNHPLISPGAPVVHGRDGATNWQQESSVTTTAAFQPTRLLQNETTRYPPVKHCHGDQPRPATAKAPPTSFHNGNAPGLGRSGSVDRGRTHSASQRDRRRSASAGDKTMHRSTTFEPNASNGREIQMIDQAPQASSQRYVELRNGPSRARERRNSTVMEQPTALDEHHPSNIQNVQFRASQRGYEPKDSGTMPESGHYTAIDDHNGSEPGRGRSFGQALGSPGTLQKPVTEPPKPKTNTWNNLKAKWKNPTQNSFSR